MERTANALTKVDRMRKTLHHQEADRVPVSDFFWGSFIERWRADLGLPADANIYEYYDLDWQVTIPNMDPHIRPFEVVRAWAGWWPRVAATCCRPYAATPTIHAGACARALPWPCSAGAG